MSSFVSTASYLAQALLALNACIFVHELGHWLFAKWHKMRTPVFSIGFGPRQYSLVLGRFWDTEFRISPIPLGGYVKIEGLAEDSEGESDVAKVPHYAVWRRATVLAAGVLFNVLFAFVIVFGILVSRGGFDGYDVTVHSLASPAPQGDVRINDMIIAVEGNRIDTLDDLTDFEANKPVVLQIQRGSEQLDVTVIANKDGGLGIDSVTGAAAFANLGPVEAAQQSLDSVVGELKHVLAALGSIVHVSQPVQGASVSEVRGVIGIVEMGTASAAAGFLSLLLFVVTININLAVMNLLPLPLLDGGHLLFLAIEKVRGRPLGKKVQTVVFSIGGACLFGFMLWALKNDIVILLSGGLTLKSAAVIAALVVLILWVLKDTLRSSFTKKPGESQVAASVEGEATTIGETELLPGNDQASSAPVATTAGAAEKKQSVETTKS
jgi:regulator of sigma E protease